MPAKAEHKIMKHGTSGVVVIPKPYRDYHNLKTGSTVTVLYDSLLLIIPKSRAHLIEDKAALIDQLLGQPKNPEPRERELPQINKISVTSQ
jgi:antitoxin component of MazEF toxin-antitoxin module